MPATVQQTRTPGVLGDMKGRVRRLEAVTAAWVQVGTPGVDGVDALIALNPPPYDRTPWVPFVNGTGVVKFCRDPVTRLTHVLGKPTGLAPGDVCFALPPLWRPIEDEPGMSRGAGPLAVAFWLVRAADGAVIFEGSGVVT